VLITIDRDGATRHKKEKRTVRRSSTRHMHKERQDMKGRTPVYIYTMYYEYLASLIDSDEIWILASRQFRPISVKLVKVSILMCDPRSFLGSLWRPSLE
jgi:hypothetical protein